MSPTIPIILAIDDPEYRVWLASVINALGYTPERVGDCREAYGLTPLQRANGIIFLDTNDDVAYLVQIVNDLYRSPYHPGGGVPVVCIVSGEAFEKSRRLGIWLIDGGAAVFAVWMRNAQVEHDVRSVLHYFARNEPAEIVPPLASYADLLEELLARPNDADVLMRFARRLMVWQNDHQMNREMRIALLRHAARLQPDNAEAHLLLGNNLSVHGEKAEAEHELREAIRLAPNTGEAHQHLGQLLRDSKRMDEAEYELALAHAILSGKGLGN